MQLFIRSISGKTVTLEIEPRETVGNLKSIIQDREGVPSEIQLLIHHGKVLEDVKTLQQSVVMNNDTIHASIRFGKVCK